MWITMFVTVFCYLFFITISGTNADNVQSIKLSLYNDKVNGISYVKCNASKIYTLLENESAEVVVEHDKYINSVDCHFSGNTLDKYLDGNATSTDTKSVHRKSSSFFVNRNRHSNKWECIVLTNRGVSVIQPVVRRDDYYTQVKCTFRVHVRPTISPVITKVNGYTLNTTRTSLSEEYDHIGQYDFAPGETINVDCETTSDKSNLLTYEYYNYKENKVLISKKTYAGKSSFTTNLTTEYDGSNWQCTFINIYNENYDIHVLRISLSQQTRKNNMLAVRVNGEAQTPSSIDNQYIQIYEYQCGAEITVECERQESAIGSLLFRYKNGSSLNDTGLKWDDTSDGTKISAKLELEEIDTNSTLHCILQNKGKDVKIYTLIFINANSYPVVIKGFNKSRVTGESREQNDTYHRIRYQYTDGEILKLQCFQGKYNPNVQCTFSISKGGVNSTNSVANVSQPIIMETYHLDITNDGGVIKCKCKLRGSVQNSNKAIIELVYHPTVKGGDNEFWRMAQYAGSAAVCLIIIIIIIYVISRRICKTRIKNDQTDINYENLPHHNEGRSAPFPQQWNDDVRPTNAVLESPTYSVPYNQDADGDLYATPVSKNDRNTYCLYAQIAKEAVNAKKNNNYANSDSLYAEVSKNSASPAGEANYAQVVPKAQRNKADNDYKNVFKNERYANADAQEYAEPAYCAVNFKSIPKKQE